MSKPHIVRILTFDPDEMAERGRLGGLTTSRRHDPHVTTAHARAAFDARFLDLVDPDRVLPEPERTQRVAVARREYFQKLATLSAASRRRKAVSS